MDWITQAEDLEAEPTSGGIAAPGDSGNGADGGEGGAGGGAGGVINTLTFDPATTAKATPVVMGLIKSSLIPVTQVMQGIKLQRRMRARKIVRKKLFWTLHA